MPLLKSREIIIVYTFVYEHLHHFLEWNIPLQDVMQEIKEQMR